MKRDVLLFVKDVLSNIADVEEFVKGMDFNSFTQDKKTNYEVFRCIEVMVVSKV